LAWATLPAKAPEVNPISAPPSCLRITAAAARKTVKCPLRCVAITASHSSSDMLKSIRSRRMPATATTPSMRPQVSTAVATSRSPDSILEMSSATATASPPLLVISATTASATSLLGSSPAMPTPKSATRTLAPSAAAASATARPIPPPPPVTATILPSRNPAIDSTLLISRGPTCRAGGARNCRELEHVLACVGGLLPFAEAGPDTPRTAKEAADG